MTRIAALIGHKELAKLQEMAKPDFKPDTRIIDPPALRRKLHADRMCRRCETERADQPHHIVHKSQRGDDVEHNIMPLCFGCHVYYHDHGPCYIRLTKKEVAYVYRKLGRVAGRDYLERRYLYAA